MSLEMASEVGIPHISTLLKIVDKPLPMSNLQPSVRISKIVRRTCMGTPRARHK